MPKPRKVLVSLETTPYHHCVSRCVRRAFLCGGDAHSDLSDEHRRTWIGTRIQALSKVFALDICACAVMPNHYHGVLHVDRERAIPMGRGGGRSSPATALYRPSLQGARRCRLPAQGKPMRGAWLSASAESRYLS